MSAALAVVELRVTTETVMQAIRAYAESVKPFFTTCDIARAMGVEEYPVRAAVSWLNRYRMIEIVPGVRSRRYTKLHGEEYSATVYQIREKGGEADFNVLYRAFGYGR